MSVERGIRLDTGSERQAKNSATPEINKILVAPDFNGEVKVPNVSATEPPQFNGHRKPDSPHGIQLKPLYVGAPGDEPIFFDKYSLSKKDSSDFLKEYPDAMMLNDFMGNPDAYKVFAKLGGGEIKSKWNKIQIDFPGGAKLEVTPHEPGNKGVLHIPSKDSDQFFSMHKNGALHIVKNNKELTFDLIFPQTEGAVDVIRITKNKVAKRTIKKNEMDLEENKKTAAIANKIAEKWQLRGGTYKDSKSLREAIANNPDALLAREVDLPSAPLKPEQLPGKVSDAEKVAKALNAFPNKASEAITTEWILHLPDDHKDKIAWKNNRMK